MISDASNPVHPTMVSSMPYTKPHGSGAWEGHILVENNLFKHFSATTKGGQRNTLIRLGIGSVPDYSQIHYFTGNTFQNVSQKSFAMIEKPPSKWANIKDCGNFPCTGPLNVLWYFKQNVWNNPETISEVVLGNNFQIIANNEGFAPHDPTCVFVKSWNAYVCQNLNMAVLVFQSLDADNMDRSQQPIYVQKENTQINNKLNAYMDHCWDGFYTCQKRLQRFVSIVESSPGSVLNLVYTGTPAKSQRFTLENKDTKLGSTIRIAFPDAMARQMLKDNKVINYNPWNDILKTYGQIDQRFCGENRFIGVQNIFEFYITTEQQCVLELKTRDAIMVSVRMEWTYAEFFAEGGTTLFVDRVAASLGIHASEIKIVSVYEGSLIIIYNIFSPFDDPAELEQIRAKQVQIIATNNAAYGAPIMDSTVKTEDIVQNGVVVASGYEPIVIYRPAPQNGNNNGGVIVDGTTQSSTANGGSTTTRVYNVQTGTRKEFNQQQSGYNNKDYFDGVKVITEQQRINQQYNPQGNQQYNQQGQSNYDQVQQQKMQQQQALLRTKLEQEQTQAKEAEDRLQTMRVALITVVAVVMIGLTIYGMIKCAHSFAPPKEVPRSNKEEELAQTEIRVLNTDGQTTQQYDATKDFNTIFNTQTKLKLEQEEEQEEQLKMKKKMAHRHEMHEQVEQKQQVNNQMEKRRNAKMTETQSRGTDQQQNN
jgi:hypothetical protein